MQNASVSNEGIAPNAKRLLWAGFLAILAAGALASLLLAVVAAVTADVARGRILEPWQVERLVGVPVSVRL